MGQWTSNSGNNFKGIVVAGDIGFIASASDNKIYKTVIPGPEITVSAEPKAMTTDGTKLYVVVEGNDAIFEIDQKTLRIIRKFEINRKFNGRELLKKKGHGLEAIVFVPDPSHPEGGTFWVGNQSFDLRPGKEPSVICQINIPILSSRKKKAKGKIIGFFSMDTIDISGLAYDTRRNQLVVINDKPNLLQEVGIDGQVLHQYQLPGKDQEGVALDTMGYIYIAQEDGEIVKFKTR